MFVIWTRVPLLYFFCRNILTACASLIGLLAALSLSSQAQVVVAMGQNFTASTFRVDSDSVPPDPNGAAGPNHFVELINGRFSVFNKSDGTKVKTLTDLSFWAQAGISIPNGWDVTDPRLIYDPVSQRWFASQIDFDPSGVINTNRFLLAISATSDPTGTWKAVAIPSDPGGNSFADFPTLGLDAQGVYLSGDMFDTNSIPLNASLVSLPKAALLNSSPSTSGLTRFSNLSYSTRGQLLQPVTCFDGSGQGNILSTGGVGVDNNGNVTTNVALVTFQVQNPAGPGQATLSSATRLSVTPFTAPPDPIQPDGSTNLDDGDARFSAKVYAVKGVIYAVHGVQVGDRAGVRWYRIDAANKKVLESGTLSDPVKDFFYPSIAANDTGTVVIAYNVSSISTFVSSFAVVGVISNGVTAFNQPILLSSSGASYQRPDSTGTSRWGDYSATSVDPVDPTRFWTIQELPASATAWSTQVTELLTGTPSLVISTTGQTVQLSWSGTLFTLQTATSPANAAWSAVTTGAVTNKGVVTVQLPISGSSAFFRLDAP
jgi:hypothetical protein